MREGYREGGKVKHRILANLSHCSDEEIEAIRIALKMKKQIVYGLLTDEQGEPISIEGFCGNTKDNKTCPGRLPLRRQFMTIIRVYLR